MTPRFRPVADHALLIEFGDAVDDAVHGRVLELDRALTARPIPGFREAIPALVNILVDFDPMVTDHCQVERNLRALLSRGGTRPAPAAPHQVEVCYDADLGRDLDDVAHHSGLSTEAVIAAHLAGDYRVFMYGFAPGYAYLNGVPEAIRLDRKPAPVWDVAAGSVIIAGAQCLITTLVMPTGWWVIGRSPTPILLGDAERPFLFDVDDPVCFRRIDRATFAARTEGRP